MDYLGPNVYFAPAYNGREVDVALVVPKAELNDLLQPYASDLTRIGDVADYSMTEKDMALALGYPSEYIAQLSDHKSRVEWHCVA